MTYEKVAVQDKGWTDRNIFVQSLDHFIFYVKPSKEAPVLLILDGHISHTGNLNAIEKAEQNGIVKLSLPPHSSHRMQPLDVTDVKPLSAYFNQATDRWMRTRVGCAIQIRHIGVLLTEAFNQASVVATVVKGFERTGIWHPHRHVFSDDDFTATSVAINDSQPAVKAASSQPTPQEATQEPNNNSSSDAPTNVQSPPPEATQQTNNEPSFDEPTNVQSPPPEATQQPKTSHHLMHQPTCNHHQEAIQQPKTSHHLMHQPTCNQLTKQPMFLASYLSNLTSQSPVPVPDKLSHITTKGDGRCFFRSVVVCTTEFNSWHNSGINQWTGQTIQNGQ